MENKIENRGTAKIELGGKNFELPVYGGTMGPDAVDVRALYKNSGHFTFDPGYTSTASTESQITFIDGLKGQLLGQSH